MAEIPERCATKVLADLYRELMNLKPSFGTVYMFESYLGQRIASLESALKTLAEAARSHICDEEDATGCELRSALALPEVKRVMEEKNRL